MAIKTETQGNPRTSIGLVSLCLALLLGGCVTHKPDGRERPAPGETYAIERVIENILYSREGWPEPLRGDLYLPRSNERHPVVLMIHGGSWSGRSRDDMTEVSEKLAGHGYAVFNVSYRFAPAYPFPAQLRDLDQALGWIAENAERYALDASRISAWGYSSGAHLAALLASYDSDNSPAREGDRSLPRIRAVVAGGIPSDLRKYDDSPIVSRFLGGARDELPAVYAEASPVFHISADDPPVFLYHGRMDLLVTPDQATDYFRALRERGVDAELYLHGLRGHGTMFVFGGEAEDRAIAFLNRNNNLVVTGGF